MNFLLHSEIDGLLSGIDGCVIYHYLLILLLICTTIHETLGVPTCHTLPYPIHEVNLLKKYYHANH